MKVHNYLYRFNIKRLNFLQRDAPLKLLFKVYYENYGKNRIEESPVMRKYKEAYFEAAEIILKKSSKTSK